VKIKIRAGLAIICDGQVFYRSDKILIGSLMDYSEAIRLLH